MEPNTSFIRVLGNGHLAAAVRMRLHHLRLPASDMDCTINSKTIRSESAALFLACSDFENATLRRSLTERARADHTTLLFACLAGHTAKVGPLVSPFPTDTPFPHHLTRSWDFSPDTCHLFPTHTADTRRTHLAQIGATFIIGELANIMYGRVTKIESPKIETLRGFPEIHDGTMVVVESGWEEVCGVAERVWHYASL
jgi:hypothetical protein